MGHPSFDPFFAEEQHPFSGSAFDPSALETPQTAPNLFIDFLEEEPDIPFFGALGRSDPTPNQRDFFQNQRNNIFNQFQGILDQQIRAGELPSARFAEFVNQPNFFEEQFRSQQRPQATPFTNIRFR